MADHARYEDVNIWLPTEMQEALAMDYASHWHACILGPPAYGSFEPMRFTVDCILTETLEEATQVIWTRVYEMCQIWRIEYEEDDWEILHIVLRNGQ